MPIPGSPPTRTREPDTMPSPSTRSSSLKPVEIRSCSCRSISDSSAGFTAGARLRLPDPRDEEAPEDVILATGSSTMVFHALQAGHCPIHLLDSYPHSLQKNAVVLAFAILLFSPLKKYTHKGRNKIVPALSLISPSGFYWRFSALTFTAFPSSSSTLTLSLPLIFVIILPAAMSST